MILWSIVFLGIIEKIKEYLEVKGKEMKLLFCLERIV